MSEDHCETVEVVSSEAPGGYMVINKDDYNPSVHRVFGAKEEEPIIAETQKNVKAGRPKKH